MYQEQCIRFVFSVTTVCRSVRRRQCSVWTEINYIAQHCTLSSILYGTTKKCIKIYNACVKLLYGSANSKLQATDQIDNLRKVRVCDDMTHVVQTFVLVMVTYHYQHFPVQLAIAILNRTRRYYYSRNWEDWLIQIPKTAK